MAGFRIVGPEVKHSKVLRYLNMEKWIDFELMVGQLKVINVLESAGAKTIHICKYTSAEPRQKEIY